MTVFNQYTCGNFVYTVTREPRKDSMVEWYDANHYDKRKHKPLSICLRKLTLAKWYDVAKVFGSFQPQWVA